MFDGKMTVHKMILERYAKARARYVPTSGVNRSPQTDEQIAAHKVAAERKRRARRARNLGLSQ